MPTKRCVVPRRPHRPCALACVRPTPELLAVSSRRQEPCTRLYNQTVTVTACGGQTVRLDTDTSPGKWRELCGLSVCPKHRLRRPGSWTVLDRSATFGAATSGGGACPIAPPAAVNRPRAAKVTALAGPAVECSSRGGTAAATWANSVEVVAAPAISMAVRRNGLRMDISSPFM